jgi:hypothetical protein
VLGVTGHRAFRAADEEPLSTLVASIVADLRSMYSHTPLILLTPLAEGADRLVAEVALAAGAWLVVPMPFARRTYEATFRDHESRRHFNRLLTHPRTLRVLELPELPDRAGAGRFDEDTRRRSAYLQCGAFVARHSQILIALWDGQPGHGAGGTADVVAYRRTGRLPRDTTMLRELEQAPEPYAIPQRPLDAPEFGPVYHIVAPRSGPHESMPVDAFTYKRLALAMYDDHPEQATAYFDQLERQWRDIDQRNADWPTGARPKTVSTDREPMIAALASVRAGAAALAGSNQRDTYAALTFIFVAVLAAAIAFEGWADLAKSESIGSLFALAAYILVIVGAYPRYRRGRVTQTAFQDCRALTEGLRVQLAWRRAGLPHSAADHYLRKHTDELTWIRDAVDAWSSITPPANPPDLDAAEAWIADQRHFYRRATERDAEELATHRQGGVGWVSAAMVGATVLVILRSVLGLRRVPVGGTAFWEYILVLAMIAVAGYIFTRRGLSRLMAADRNDVGDTMDRSALFTMLGGVFRGVMVVIVVVAIPSFIARARDVLNVGVPDWLVLERHAWIVVAFGLATLAGALHHAFADQRAFAEHRNQYERMAKLFERAHAAFTERRAAGDTAAIQSLLVALGTEALAEHADWLVLHRERPLQIPKVEL